MSRWAAERVETWDGLTNAGTPVPDGAYRVLIGPADGRRRARRQAHALRPLLPGPGAARHPWAGRRVRSRSQRRAGPHRASTSPLAAGRRWPRRGRARWSKRAFDPRLDGNFIVIRGLGERRKYRYSHMARPSRFRQGDRRSDRRHRRPHRPHRQRRQHPLPPPLRALPAGPADRPRAGPARLGPVQLARRRVVCRRGCADVDAEGNRPRWRNRTGRADDGRLLSFSEEAPRSEKPRPRSHSAGTSHRIQRAAPLQLLR